VKACLESTVSLWSLAAAALLLPGLALASVGTVTVLEGTATRTNGGQTVALQAGSEIELNDTIEVGSESNVKLTLTDESVLMLSERSRLIIDEATFEGQERKGFVARLGFGKAWARVKKALAGSDSKFEVQTDRAVAGVRGTIFRVDYVDKVKAMMPTEKLRMVVRVVEGRVVVTQEVRKAVTKKLPSGPEAKPGERKQIAGPQEVTEEQWEKIFIDLQKKKQVTVDSELTPGKVEALDMKAMKDKFGQFVERNQ
jgi:hypothetical protein